MSSDGLHERLRIPDSRLAEINDFLLDPENETVSAVVDLVRRYGGPEAINQKAEEARRFERLMERLRDSGSPYYQDVEWLIAQREERAFVTMADYRRGVMGEHGSDTAIDEAHAVTLEISALQYFPFLIAEAKESIEKRDLMPGRYIRVRNMREQVEDNADIVATAVAMQVIGASYVETLDTRGTDGANVHLGGPETIAGYFGGIGQPNEYALHWAEEYLEYYTTYGIRQVLNVNDGTILIAYLMHRLGVDCEFKISVFFGSDNPYSMLWTMLMARLFARDDGSTPLVGFNPSNSTNNQTLRQAAAIREALELEEKVRFEHHVVESWKSIVIQPYDRLEEMVELAGEVKNLAAKHEGGIPDVERTLDHPSDILDYFLPKEEVTAQGLMPALERNYLEKHRALNRTADALTRAGIGVICAQHLHG